MRRAPVRMTMYAKWITLAACLILGSLCATAQEATPEGTPAPATEQPAVAESAPPADAPEPAEKDESPQKPTRWISGRIDADFDGIWSRDDREIDLNQTLKLNVEIPGHDTLHVRSLFWLREDIDSNDDNTNPLRDIDDNSDSDVDLQPVYLYLDIDDLWGESVLRLGRQRIQEGSSFARIDGAYFKQTRDSWDWYVFAGWQASLYDQSFDDPAAGGGVSWQATSNTRIALDAYWISENRIHYTHYYRPRLSDLLYSGYPTGLDNDVDDSVVSVSVWQTLGQYLRIMARLDLHDGSTPEVTIQATGTVPKIDVAFELTVRRLFDDLGDRSSDLTSFNRILGPEDAYTDVLLVLHRAITKHLALSLEGEIRNTDNESDRERRSYWDQAYEYHDKANQDLRRYAATLSATDLAWGLSANASFEYWDIDNFENSWNSGASITKKWNALTLTLGADYSHYETTETVYNIWPYARNEFRRAIATSIFGISSPIDTFYYDSNFTVNLRDVKPVDYNDDIIALHAEGSYALRTDQTITFGVTYEEDDTDDSPYWRIRAGYSLTF